MFSYFWVAILFFKIDFSSSQQQQCGKESVGGGLSYGGVPSESYESPWKVAIIFKYDNGTRAYICGGVLINNDTVVTGKKSNNIIVSTDYILLHLIICVIT